MILILHKLIDAFTLPADNRLCIYDEALAFAVNDDLASLCEDQDLVAVLGVLVERRAAFQAVRVHNR